ncbi:MAG: hypothetical protein IJP62_11580 [Treponema sp.]|nr:hypothetical protein [Treponema sp.]
MSLEKVKAYFSGTEFDGKIIEFDTSSATVELAAAALGCDGDMIAKTDFRGVCPFALDPSIPVYLDVSLKKHDFVYPAAGSSNSAVKMTIAQLEKYSGFREWIDVGK